MKNGFTLIELVVIMALFSLIMLAGMSFLIGSKTNFERSQDASEIHYQVRMASEYIRDEVRNAISMELVEIPASYDTNYEYLFVENNKLIHVVSGLENDKSLDVLIDDANMFTVLQEVNGNCIITYTIQGFISGSGGDRNFEIPTSVYLNNLFELLDLKGSELTDGPNECIKYQKPSPTVTP